MTHHTRLISHALPREASQAEWNKDWGFINETWRTLLDEPTQEHLVHFLQAAFGWFNI